MREERCEVILAIAAAIFCIVAALAIGQAFAAPGAAIPRDANRTAGVPAIRAHGDAAWIMDSPITRHCCGPTDCARLPDDAVTAAGDGWIFEGRLFMRGDPNVYPSNDGHFWACRFGAGAGQIRCFFYPPPST